MPTQLEAQFEGRDQEKWDSRDQAQRLQTKAEADKLSELAHLRFIDLASKETRLQAPYFARMLMLSIAQACDPSDGLLLRAKGRQSISARP